MVMLGAAVADNPGDPARPPASAPAPLPEGWLAESTRNLHMRRRPLSLAALAALVIAAHVIAAGCSAPSSVTPVPAVPLSSLIVTPETDTILVGDSRTFAVSALDTAGGVVSNPIVTWVSGNTNVFTVSNAGTVTGRGEGIAPLYASSGGQADTSLVAVYVQPGWYVQPSGTTNNLNGVFFQPNGFNGVAVGDAGTIVRTTNSGASWATQPSNTAFNLNDVWFTTANTGFAAGHGGTIMRTRNGGATWTRLTVPASENLYGICFADTSRGWAVGSNGTIVRTSNAGQSWTRSSPTAQVLRSVSFSDSLTGWAVGDGGVIVGTHDAGRSWYVVQPSVTALALRAVWRRSLTQAWAGGAAGANPVTVATPDSLQWTLGNVGANNEIFGLQMVNDLTGYAVGNNGTGLVLKTLNGGLTWDPQVANTSQFLRDVWFIDSLRGWAVGSGGRILHTAKGGL